MNVRAEHAHGVFRVRVTDCGCGADDCGTGFLFATVHEVLWVAVGMGGMPRMLSDGEAMSLDAGVDASVPDLVSHAVALFGQTWPMLTVSRDRVFAQLKAFDAVPHWMLEVPVRQVWACRRVVFGEELTRVPRALAALDAAYVHERPAVRRGGAL